MSFNESKYNYNFAKENYARISILIPKDKKEELQDYAKCNGISVNALTLKALHEYTQIDFRMKSQK